MADNDDFKAAKTLDPGTIDKVRQNLGPIDPKEAMAMSKKLGGEILKERPAPVDPNSMPRRRTHNEVIRASGISASAISAKSASLSSTTTVKNMGSVNQLVTFGGKRKKTDDDLPAISSRDLKMMDRLMMSEEYDLKPNFGFFNMLFRMSQKNREKVTKKFGSWTIKKHVEHMQTFISTIKSFIQLAPDSYKSKIATETDLKFKFLRTIGKWTMRDIKVLALDLENVSEILTVSMLIPFTRAVYHELLTIYYIGEQQVPLLIKEIYSDIALYPEADKNKMQMLAKEGITEWIYIYNQIIKGMYPLLMRMCSNEYVEFPRFFTAQIANILRFLNLTKFDLLLPEKNKKKAQDNTKKNADAEKKKKEEENRHVAGKKDDLVMAGLKLLEQLFPQAGFSNLEAHPDLYPYFQPLYDFDDGFNMLHPENPLQVVVVLLRITEDFLQGCRNIEFNLKADEKLSALPDDFNLALNEWASYHEDLFDKKYGDYFRTYVNSLYSQRDYGSTQYGKENLNNFMWRAKYYFLPHYKFSAPILTKPSNDSRYKPLFSRTDYLRTVFTTFAQRIDSAAAEKKTVLGIMNPWERYSFDLPNVVSKRIDVLLGAKRMENTNATNANLLKYTLCMIAVLDWWINNPQSPAYTGNPEFQYRISAKDGAPEFSVPLRTDQNSLFMENLKKSMAAKKKE